eukprot:5738538-Amphidinium_carterae.2
MQASHHQQVAHSRQKIVAQSSAESEILALAAAYQATLNFTLITSETLPFTNLPNLRCDNQAVIAMLESPSWRSRHIMEGQSF